MRNDRYSDCVRFRNRKSSLSCWNSTFLVLRFCEAEILRRLCRPGRGWQAKSVVGVGQVRCKGVCVVGGGRLWLPKQLKYLGSIVGHYSSTIEQNNSIVELLSSTIELGQVNS